MVWNIGTVYNTLNNNSVKVVFFFFFLISCTLWRRRDGGVFEQGGARVDRETYCGAEENIIIVYTRKHRRRVHVVRASPSTTLLFFFPRRLNMSHPIFLYTRYTPHMKFKRTDEISHTTKENNSVVFYKRKKIYILPLSATGIGAVQCIIYVWRRVSRLCG